MTLFFAIACVASAQPTISAVLNGASYNAVVSPGCWVAIFGTNLAPSVASARVVPLPPTLGGASVTVAGVTASLLYVSSTQINALIPFEVVIPASTVVPLVVSSSAGSATYNIRLTRDAPALFARNATGAGRALVFDPNFQLVDTIKNQDVVILYAAGLGPVDGTGHVVDPPEVYVGERRAQLLFAGLAPGFPGIYQLNVMAPALATDRIYLRSGGWQSNIVDIGIPARANAVNVTGTIDGLNPSADPNYPTTPQRPCVGNADPGPCGPTAQAESFAFILHAGTFTVSFDIAPSAVAFDVAAVSEGGSSITTINPAALTYTSSVTTLSAAETHGDFSSVQAPLWDYISCDWQSAVCRQFPSNVIPLTRLPPILVRAFQMLPLPNIALAGNLNATLQASGALSGSHFAIDGQNNSELSKFGGIVEVPYSPLATQVSTFKLYVDGKLIASKDLSYLVYQRAQGPLLPDF